MFKKKTPFIFFLFFIIANFVFWQYSHKIQAEWANVPPPPAQEKASLLAIGDRQLAYRSYATMLQNLGNTGGRGMALKKYDYEKLRDWFFLTDKLDPLSDAVPMLASSYFGAVDDPKKIDYVLDYLEIAGARAEREKWRWLAQAVFLARHIQKDNDRALDLAYKLASNKNPDMADWAKQMPAFILQDEGQSELAYKIMLNILISNIDTLHPNEINYMQDYICNTLLVDLSHIDPPPFCGLGG
jgi:hypothetical protein